MHTWARHSDHQCQLTSDVKAVPLSGRELVLKRGTTSSPIIRKTQSTTTSQSRILICVCPFDPSIAPNRCLWAISSCSLQLVADLADKMALDHRPLLWPIRRRCAQTNLSYKYLIQVLNRSSFRLSEKLHLTQQSLRPSHPSSQHPKCPKQRS